MSYNVGDALQWNGDEETFIGIIIKKNETKKLAMFTVVWSDGQVTQGAYDPEDDRNICERLA